ncbi:MAG: type II toxin-antitoxin system PemK/MazF family toxin [Patescibacteria group bacterium]
MSKDFDVWNGEKKGLHEKGEVPRYYPREIWWIAFGTNIGIEIDGTGTQHDRPAVIIKGFNRQQCFAAPLTGKKQDGRYHFFVGEIDGRKASVALTQVRIIDTRRLIRKIGMLDQNKYRELIVRLIDLLFITKTIDEKNQ